MIESISGDLASSLSCISCWRAVRTTDKRRAGPIQIGINLFGGERLEQDCAVQLQTYTETLVLGDPATDSQRHKMFLMELVDGL